MNTTVKSYPTIKQAIGLALYFILFSVIAALIGAFILDMFNLTKDKSLTSLSNLIDYTLSMLFTIWIGRSKVKQQTATVHQLKFSGVPWIVVLVIIAITLFQCVIMDYVDSLIPMPDSIKKMFANLFDSNIASFITVVIAAPVLEEILFRGIILNGFLKKYTPTKAIVVSALIFSLIHLNPWQAIPAFFGGVLMGWLYWKTNSIIPGMISHFVNNLLGMLLSVIFPHADNLRMLLGTPVYIILAILGTLIIIAGYWYLNNYFNLNPKAEEPEQLLFDDTILPEPSATPTIAS